jgi:hypothetical protein
MITRTVSDCAPCQANTDNTTHEPLIPSSLPMIKNGLVSLDFSSRSHTGEYILVAIYESGRLPAVKLAKNLTSEEAIRIATDIFTTHGIPKNVKTKNGPALRSKEFSDFAKKLGFNHIKIAPLNAEANGICERFMEVLNKSIRCAVVENQPWKNVVSKMLKNNKATPHTSTRISPDFFMEQEDKYDRLPTMHKECEKN